MDIESKCHGTTRTKKEAQPMSSPFYQGLDSAARDIEALISLLRRPAYVSQNLGAKYDQAESMIASLTHALDDLSEAAGQGRRWMRAKAHVGKFDPGDRVMLIIQSLAASEPGLGATSMRPIMEDGVVGKAAVIRKVPAKRSPNNLEKFEDRVWFFTADLPVAVTSRIDGDMHVDLGVEIREVYHLAGEHWSTWHETTEGEGGRFSSILTIFPDDRAFDFEAREAHG
jgi:hypothetical protein